MSMTPDALAELLSEQPRSSDARRRWFTAAVTASHAGGVFITELGHPETDAHKVTWGGTYRDVSTCPGGNAPHSHPPINLPRGTIVLAVETGNGVWVARHHLGGNT